MKKDSIKNLSEDILAYINSQQVLSTAKPLDLDKVKKLSDKIAEAVERSLLPRTGHDLFNEKKIYVSDLGKCPRQLYYKYRTESVLYETDPISPENILKFLYGDVIEELLIFLIEASGHEVSSEQDMVQYVLKDGWKLTGRMDLRVDGQIVDVKSASNYAFKKFKEDEITDDAFGYRWQIFAYAGTCKNTKKGHFLVMNKQTGELKVTSINFNLPQKDLHAFVTDMGNKTVDILCADSPPEIPSEFSDSVLKSDKYGRKKLPVTCSYCAYKKTCRPNLRTLLYSYGPFDWVTQNENEYKSQVRVPEVQYVEKEE